MRNKMKWLLLAVFTMAALGASAQQRPVKLGHIESSKLIAGNGCRTKTAGNKAG